MALILKRAGNISKIYPTPAPENYNHITLSSPQILKIQVTTFKLSLDLTSNWETRVALIYYLIFHGIKLSNVMLSGIFKNIDFHRLYRGTVFQKKVFEDQRGNVWQHAMDVKTNPTTSNSCFQALTRKKKKHNN